MFCGFLSSGIEGRIYGGIVNGRVFGLRLDRDQSDRLRLGIDRVMRVNIEPKLFQHQYDIRFFPVEGTKGLVVFGECCAAHSWSQCCEATNSEVQCKKIIPVVGAFGGCTHCQRVGCIQSSCSFSTVVRSCSEEKIAACDRTSCSVCCTPKQCRCFIAFCTFSASEVTVRPEAGRPLTSFPKVVQGRSERQYVIRNRETGQTEPLTAQVSGLLCDKIVLQ